MAKQNKSRKIQADEKKWAKSEKRDTKIEAVGGSAGLAEIPGPIAAAGSGGGEAQASRLGDPRLQTGQRQTLAAQIGQVQGNRHLQRVISRLPDLSRSRPTVNQPGDAPERETEKAAGQVMTGEPPQVSQPATADIQRNWLTDAASAVGNAVGDALNVRDNEAALDEWEDYQDAITELDEFHREAPHKAENFQSSTNIGYFDAIYKLGENLLNIVVKCKFNFVNGSTAEFPDAPAEALQWTDQAAKDDWKSRFISTVSTAWSTGNHVFYCQKDWWELLMARTKVDIVEADEDEHFAVTITKIPPGEFRTSSVRSPVTLPVIGAVTGGSGDFDSEDLNTVPKPGGRQTPAVHEAGHMLGLDDEYLDEDGDTPAHSDLVESEFGDGVARGSDGRIMSGGNDIEPEHGVTFLEALKEATDMSEWSTSQKEPRSIPVNPDSPPLGPGDFPEPSSDTRAV